jgi:hypothetical protein
LRYGDGAASRFGLPHHVISKLHLHRSTRFRRRERSAFARGVRPWREKGVPPGNTGPSVRRTACYCFELQTGSALTADARYRGVRGDRRHGDLRIRPNRPRPSRTRTLWLSCASSVFNARAAQHVLNRLQQFVRPRRAKPSSGSRRECWQSCSPTHH